MCSCKSAAAYAAACPAKHVEGTGGEKVARRMWKSPASIAKRVKER